jgi:hypothetical protein
MAFTPVFVLESLLRLLNKQFLYDEWLAGCFIEVVKARFFFDSSIQNIYVNIGLPNVVMPLGIKMVFLVPTAMHIFLVS